MQKVVSGNQIRQYFSKQVAKFENNLYKSVCSHDEEAIHDLRVSIKRIRALFRFLAEYRILRPHSKNYLFKIKKIYAPLGVLRDLQIKSNLVAEYHIDEISDYMFFIKWLEAQQFRSKVKLKNVFRQFSFREFYRFKHRLPYVRNNSVALDHDRILKRRLLKINKLMRQGDLQQSLHDIRKKFKDIYYFLEMCELGKTDCMGIALDLDSIKNLEDAIGQWHDCVLLIQELQLGVNEEHPLLSNRKSELRSQLNHRIDQLYPQIVLDLEPYKIGSATPISVPSEHQ